MDRNTRQRHAIELVFKAAERPLNVQEVLEEGQKILPALGIATVYRAVKTLLEENWLVAVQIPGDILYYEPAGKSHHHHFRCQKCNKVYELQDCLSDFSKLMPPGFRLDSHEVVLYGSCRSCTKKR
jgi:Fur family ferric uptake transcriptional regulator